MDCLIEQTHPELAVTEGSDVSSCTTLILVYFTHSDTVNNNNNNNNHSNNYNISIQPWVILHITRIDFYEMVLVGKFPSHKIGEKCASGK